jgi:hypothetical protein
LGRAAACDHPGDYPVLRAADIYRTVAEVGRAASKQDPEAVLLIEPQFLDDADVVSYHLPAKMSRWSRFGWEAGEGAYWARGNQQLRRPRRDSRAGWRTAPRSRR